MRTKNNKAYLQFSFAWLFAIIAGAVILFLAIYLSTKIIRAGQIEIDAKTAKEIGILLNPLETGAEAGKTTPIFLARDTRIYNKCNNNGFFGNQIIQVSQINFNKWTETNIDIGFSNKYIFSDEFVEGKKFYLFSKPFEYPFKIANLIFITPADKEYCFLNAPNEVKDDISNFQENLKIDGECSEKSVKVCFEGGSCDIYVKYNEENGYAEGYVEKNNERLYFTGSLLYGAIFSDKDIYECQVKRLMQRTEQLCSLYKDKSSFIAYKCDSNLDSDLVLLKNYAKEFENSEDLLLINPIVNEIREKNEANTDCKLW